MICASFDTLQNQGLKVINPISHPFNYFDRFSFTYLPHLIPPCLPPPLLKCYFRLTFDLPAKEERERHCGYRQVN